MNLFKKGFLISLKHKATSHSHRPSTNTKRRISLFQDEIELRQEQLKSKEKIINFLIEKLCRNEDEFLSLNIATLKTPENQTNSKQLPNKHQNHQEQRKPRQKHSRMRLQ